MADLLNYKLTVFSNTTPTLRAEYGNGRMVHVNISHCSEVKMSKWMNLLRTRSGQPIVELESSQTAALDSVQGMWNPLYNLSSEQNLPDWPKQKFSACRSAETSAQEYIASLAESSDECKEKVEAVESLKSAR